MQVVDGVTETENASQHSRQIIVVFCIVIIRDDRRRQENETLKTDMQQTLSVLRHLYCFILLSVR